MSERLIYLKIPRQIVGLDLATGRRTILFNAPDGKHAAFASITGLFVMQPDGSNLIQLINEGIGGSMSWIP